MPSGLFPVCKFISKLFSSKSHVYTERRHKQAVSENLARTSPACFNTHGPESPQFATFIPTNSDMPPLTSLNFFNPLKISSPSPPSEVSATFPSSQLATHFFKPPSQELAEKEGQSLTIEALPLVGLGGAYIRAGIRTIGPAQMMPSGGFLYMDRKQIVGDLQAGLMALTWEQVESFLQEFCCHYCPITILKVQ